jgi:hypothetical protein
MALPEKISGPNLLAVEGRDALAFFSRFRDSLGLRDTIQVIDFGSVSELRKRILGLPATSGFSAVKALGIIRDAEADPAAAFQSVRDALQRAKLPAPSAVGQMIVTRPRVGIFILPDGTSTGSLETLLLRTVAGDPAMPCIEDFFTCIQQRTGIRQANRDKARVHAFLASRDDPGLRSGQAFAAGYWPPEHPAFEPVRDFLRGL